MVSFNQVRACWNLLLMVRVRTKKAWKHKIFKPNLVASWNIPSTWARSNYMGYWTEEKQEVEYGQNLGVPARSIAAGQSADRENGQRTANKRFWLVNWQSRSADKEGSDPFGWCRWPGWGTGRLSSRPKQAIRSRLKEFPASRESAGIP